MSPQRRLAEKQTKTGSGMHRCPRCCSEFIQPIEWWQTAGDSWEVRLRCPECEWTGGGRYSQAAVDDFDRELDEGAEQLLNDLNRLSQAIMEEEAERFTEALNGNRILPEDF